MTSSPAHAESPAAAVAASVSRTIAALWPQRRYDRTEYARQLAVLRRAANAPVGSTPEAWAYVLDLPDDVRGRGDQPNSAETAVHAALTTWARHQQAIDRPVHVAGTPFASAVARLASGPRGGGQDEPLSPVVRRFRALATANDLTELMVHARGLVGQMRDTQQPLAFDYGRFARDLYLFDRPSSRASVQLRWGREFTRRPAFRPADEAGAVTAGAKPDSSPTTITKERS